MSLGHCSCNGPLDGLEDVVENFPLADSSEDLVATFSRGLQRGTKILIDAIRGITEPNLNPFNDGF